MKREFLVLSLMNNEEYGFNDIVNANIFVNNVVGLDCKRIDGRITQQDIEDMEKINNFEY